MQISIQKTILIKRTKMKNKNWFDSEFMKMTIKEKFSITIVSYLVNGIFLAVLLTALIRYDFWEVMRYNIIMLFIIFVGRSYLKSEASLKYTSCSSEILFIYFPLILMFLQLFLMIKFIFFE